MGRTLRSFLFVSFFAASLSTAALAQAVVPGSFEVSANGGITNISGVDNKKGHGTFGFDAAYNPASHVAIAAEYNYFMLGSMSENGVTATEHLDLYGAAARFVLLNGRHVVPYVVVAGGGIHDSASASDDNVSVNASRSGAYFGVGGGVSIYATHRLGIRPEFRYDHDHFDATTVDDVAVAGEGQNVARASFAIFYQFGGHGR